MQRIGLAGTPPEGSDSETFDLSTPPEGSEGETFDLSTPPEGGRRRYFRLPSTHFLPSAVTSIPQTGSATGAQTANALLLGIGGGHSPVSVHVFSHVPATHSKPGKPQSAVPVQGRSNGMGCPMHLVGLSRRREPASLPDAGAPARTRVLVPPDGAR